MDQDAKDILKYLVAVRDGDHQPDDEEEATRFSVLCLGSAASLRPTVARVTGRVLSPLGEVPEYDLLSVQPGVFSIKADGGSALFHLFNDGPTGDIGPWGQDGALDKILPVTEDDWVRTAALVVVDLASATESLAVLKRSFERLRDVIKAPALRLMTSEQREAILGRLPVSCDGDRAMLGLPPSQVESDAGGGIIPSLVVVTGAEHLNGGLRQASFSDQRELIEFRLVQAAMSEGASIVFINSENETTAGLEGLRAARVLIGRLLGESRGRVDPRLPKAFNYLCPFDEGLESPLYVPARYLGLEEFGKFQHSAKDRAFDLAVTYRAATGPGVSDGSLPVPPMEACWQEPSLIFREWVDQGTLVETTKEVEPELDNFSHKQTDEKQDISSFFDNLLTKNAPRAR